MRGYPSNFFFFMSYLDFLSGFLSELDITIAESGGKRNRYKSSPAAPACHRGAPGIRLYIAVRFTAGRFSAPA